MEAWGGLGGLVLVLQALAAIHALKTGRAYWWLYLILFLPGIGAVIYFFAEVFPTLRRSGALSRVGSDLFRLVDPGRDLRRLQEEVEVSDSFSNRRALARGYLGAGRHEEAIAEYQRCLVGTFRDDPGVTLELAYAQFLVRRDADALATLKRLEQSDPRFRPDERRLLVARTLEAAGETQPALEQYAALAETWAGEEARCRYALLLESAGQPEKAEEVYRKILFRARRSPYYYRRAQREWIGIAKKRLSALGRNERVRS